MDGQFFLFTFSIHTQIRFSWDLLACHLVCGRVDRLCPVDSVWAFFLTREVCSWDHWLPWCEPYGLDGRVMPQWAFRSPAPQSTIRTAVLSLRQDFDAHMLDWPGFDFVLKSDGYEDISITDKNFWGTKSSNDGSFQGVVVSLSPSQLEKLARGVEYAIVPINESEKYCWAVTKGVSLIRPQNDQ